MASAGHREGPEVEEPSREPVTVAGGQFLLRAEVVQFQRGDLLDGRYQIEKGIGRGATGSVLQAFDRVVRTVVAVKILRPDLATDERWVERLGGELRYARKLQHPNVCRVFDLGEADGHHFLTMEYAGGGSLRQRLADKPERAWEDRITDARAVIEGLVAIHAAGIVHRDVKPENVLVMDDGRLVVSDFGVAVSAGQTTYFSSKVAGTPSYMAPEIIMGDKATPRADVFSLGIVLHEILFGRRPDWQMTKQGRVLRSSLPRTASKRERAFERLCTECLREFAPDRPLDAAAVKARFEQAVAGRLRPIRGLRQRWPLLVGALAVAASVGIVVKARQHADSTPSVVRAPVLLGTANDFSSARRVFTSTRVMRCFDILPDKRTARIVWSRPTEAIDVDLATGQQSAAVLRPEAFANGCPQLSPDRRRLLFVREDDSKRSMIMLSPHPDGEGATTVTEGDSPTWLPSGEEFVYAFDQRRAAAFSLPKTRVLFPDSPPFEKSLQQIAVNDAGDRVALMWLNSHRKHSLDVYSYPSMKVLEHVEPSQALGAVQFDPARNRLLLSVPDPTYLSLTELTPSGDLSRFAQIAGSNLLTAYRTVPGLALLTMNVSRAFSVQDARGDKRTFQGSLTGRADVLDDGTVIFDRRLDDGRVVIAYQRPGDAESRTLTAGPTDAYPSFDRNGRAFVFVRVDDGAIIYCALLDGVATGCRTIVTDSTGPRFAHLSPDGKLIAYQTTHGTASRLRIVSLATGQTRDLGAYRSNCPPIWSSTGGIWTYQRASADWTELDTDLGRTTGSVVKSASSADAVCDNPPRAIAASAAYQVRSWDVHGTEIRVAPR